MNHSNTFKITNNSKFQENEEVEKEVEPRKSEEIQWSQKSGKSYEISGDTNIWDMWYCMLDCHADCYYLNLRQSNCLLNSNPWITYETSRIEPMDILSLICNDGGNSIIHVQ